MRLSGLIPPYPRLPSGAMTKRTWSGTWRGRTQVALDAFMAAGVLDTVAYFEALEIRTDDGRVTWDLQPVTGARFLIQTTDKTARLTVEGDDEADVVSKFDVARDVLAYSALH